MRARMGWIIGCLSIALVAPAARAVTEFDLSVGYSHLWLEGSDSVFDSRDGFRIEPRFAFQVSQEVPQLHLGVGIGISGYSHELDSDTTITINNGDDTFIINANNWESLSLLTPEFQASWRQPLGENRKWFIEPGVGIGAAFANYWAGSDWWWGTDLTNEWSTTWTVRPFLRAGFAGDHWVFGLESSYLWGGNLDLTDQVQGDLREFYAGGFFGVKW